MRFLMNRKKGLYEKYVKRILDIICSLLAIIVFWWLYVLIWCLVRVKLGKPAIFKQKRPGKINQKTGQEVIFDIYKFRTMTDEVGENGELLPDEKRITKFGQFLRSTSLDELPEAICILKGTMSVVGPRPLMVQYLPLYNDYQRHRHDVLPGLTGLAQVNGRNSLSWNEKFNLDIEYVNNISLLLDIKIVIKTIAAAIRRDGISSETSVTMEDFKGN